MFIMFVSVKNTCKEIKEFKDLVNLKAIFYEKKRL